MADTTTADAPKTSPVAATTTQPAATPAMNLSDIPVAFDKHIEECFAVGKDLHDCKGVSKKGSNTWSSPWFAFWADIPACCMSFCGCSACVYGCIRQKAYHKQDFIADAFVACCCAGVTMCSRTTIRKKYDIEGTILTDLIINGLCLPCSLAQQNVEVNKREAKVVG